MLSKVDGDRLMRHAQNSCCTTEALSLHARLCQLGNTHRQYLGKSLVSEFVTEFVGNHVKHAGVAWGNSEIATSLYRISNQ